jgi:parallel beta-helix repeat protein
MFNYYNYKKIIINILIIILFMSNVSSFATGKNAFTSTIIVDCNGSGSFTTIQAAVNAANDGDIILVCEGTYHESIIINKSISLIGNNKEKTIIKGEKNKDTIKIISEHVSISSFTIQNSGNSGRDAGIEINANNATIEENIIQHNTIGIFIYHSNFHLIKNNTVSNNQDYGIHLYQSIENDIQNNIIESNRWGILLISSLFNQIERNLVRQNHYYGIWLSRGSSYNTIIQNSIEENNDYGICLHLFSNNNTIEGNLIKLHNFGICIGFHWSCNGNIINNNIITENANYGLIISDSQSITVTKNDFIQNPTDAFFKDSYPIQWEQNYWDDTTTPYHIIHGIIKSIPWINIDMKPTQEPSCDFDFYLSQIIPETPKESPSSNYYFPPSFIWTDMNGTNFMSPVKNQIPAPTCETYALCATLETIIQYNYGCPFDCDLSEAHLFFYPGGTCQWGVDITEPAEYLIDHGVPDEGCFPDPHRPYDASYESLSGWEERTVKITAWGWVNNSINDIKHALITHGPLVICQMTRQDLDYYEDGVYMPDINSPIQRGHVVAIVGYNDTQGCWVIRNSAGDKWGEEGYFRISYEAFDLAYSFIFPFYGGSGILYVDGIYGNVRPYVPIVRIQSPQLYTSYLYDMEFPSIIRNIPSIQRSVPRILGKKTVNVEATNTNRVEFYIDSELRYSDETIPYEWELHIGTGLHTLEIYAYNQNNTSKAMMDIYQF